MCIRDSASPPLKPKHLTKCRPDTLACLFLFPFFIFVFPFLLPLSVSPFLFVLPFSVCFSYRLLRFSFRFSAFLGGGLCSVLLSRCYTPSALLASRRRRVPLMRCLLSCVLAFVYFILLLFLTIFDFYLDVVCFIVSSREYYAVSSASVSFGTRLAYDIYLIRTYTLISPFLFSSEVYDLFHLLCVIFCFLLVFMLR